MMFDSHCHLNDDAIYPRIDEVIEDAKKTGVTKFLVVGYNKVSSELAVKIAEKYKPDIIDINAGCPVPKVAISSEAGSGLLKKLKSSYKK